MTAEILSIGNEILSGRTLDTNFHFLSKLLEESGARIVGHQTLPDAAGSIAEGLRLALERADLVITTGGLGPTPDDLTVRAIGNALGRSVALDPQVLEDIRTRWEAYFRRPMPANNEQQALIPAGANVWKNPLGSAPGIHIREGEKDIILLPGVPVEMEALARDFLGPFVRAKSGAIVEYHVIRTTGIAESVLSEKLWDLEAELSGTWVAYLPGLSGVDLRIALPFGATQEVQDELRDRARSIVRERVGDYVFAEGDRTLEETVGEVLQSRGLTLGVAESCTGGLLSGRITSIAGSSAYFTGGVVCYSNESKVALVGVPQAALNEHGAVSEEVARLLARGARTKLAADCGLSITGIAGPTGGTPTKPVGTVHVAAVTPDGETHRLLQLRGSRTTIRERSVGAALELLRRSLLGLPVTSAVGSGERR